MSSARIRDLPLLEAARLTDKEIGRALREDLPHRKTAKGKDYLLVADAATAKALWSVVDWLYSHENPAVPVKLRFDVAVSYAVDLKLLLEDQASQDQGKGKTDGL